MSSSLIKEIVLHILKNFGIGASFQNSMAINEESFLLQEKVEFEEDGKHYKNNVFGCQCSIREQKLRAIYCGISGGEKIESFLYVKLEENPAYCVYSGMEDYIYFSPDKSDEWAKCTIMLHATFLAAMENIKDISPSFEKIKDYKAEYNQFSKAINLIINE